MASAPAPVTVAATAKLKASPAKAAAMALKRLKGPPLLVSVASPHVTAIAAQAKGSRPASLARAAGNVRRPPKGPTSVPRWRRR